MSGKCAQCDESNVVMNAPIIRNILLYKNCLFPHPAKAELMQNIKAMDAKAGVLVQKKICSRRLNLKGSRNQ